MATTTPKKAKRPDPSKVIPKRRANLTGEGATFKKGVSKNASGKAASPKKAPSVELNDQQRLFAEEYIKDFNASRAARDAGYSPRTAGQIGCELLKHPKVAGYIQELKNERAERLQLTNDRVLQELARIVYFDPRKLLNADGSPKPINELDDDTAAALQGLDISEIFEGTGKDRRFVGFAKKYKVADKGTAIDKAMRHLGLLKDKLELTGKDGGAIELNDTANIDIARRIAFALTKGVRAADSKE